MSSADLPLRRRIKVESSQNGGAADYITGFITFDLHGLFSFETVSSTGEEEKDRLAPLVHVESYQSRNFLE